DGAGTDSYKLGGGDDSFLAQGLGSFTLDGGAGNDTLDLVSNQGYFANLGSVLVQVGIASIQANSARTLTSLTGGTVKNFENVVGSAKADIIVGSAGANHLNGADGGDTIIGGLGADTLTGGVD